MSEESEWLQRARAGKVPSHIGFIMDGNGRWAEKRGLQRRDGHRAGVESVRRCIPALLELGIAYCSLFVLSTENWRRPKEEVDFLLGLVLEWAQEDKRDLRERGVRILPVGRWKDMPAPVSVAIESAAKDTKDGHNLTLLTCVNYGGRQEIVDAAKAMARSFAGDMRKIENLDEEGFGRFMYAPGIPDPDLIVRTSGEERLSNFLLWQAAYSEFVFTDVFWPDMGPVDVYKAVVAYEGRRRRFGDVIEKRG